MQIIGHPWIEHPKFNKIFSLGDITENKEDEVVLLEPLVESHDLATHCKSNNVSFAVTVNTLKGALFANSLGATYMVCEKDMAFIIHPIAEQYLFDTQILVLIHDEKEIEQIARLGIDGVIFPEALI